MSIGYHPDLDNYYSDIRCEKLKESIRQVHKQNEEKSNEYLKEANDLADIDPGRSIDVRGRAIGLLMANVHLETALDAIGLQL